MDAQTTRLSYTITCDHSSNADCRNETLGMIADDIGGQSDVHINILTPQLQLNEDINFTGLHSLTITGKLDTQTSIICSTSQNVSASVVLRNISGSVELRNLNLTFCGSKVDTEFDSNIYISALTIIQCRNVELNDITIERSEGIGLMIVNHLGGEVSIESAIFRQNRLHSDYFNSYTSVYGGGGVYVMFRNIQEQPYSPNGMIFQFQNCTFENNTANTSHYHHLYTNVHGKARKGYGRGGGVYVLLSSGLRNVSVSFCDCTFTGNRAFIGSGLAVRIYGEKSKPTADIQITVKDSNFRTNGCNDNKNKNPGLGGGAHLTFASHLRKSYIFNSHYIIKNVQFMENCAELGGGVNHISGKQLQNFDDDHGSNSIIFDNCSFEGNAAHVGSAIYLASSIHTRLSTGHSIMVKISDCLFTLNDALDTNNSLSVNQITPGIGTIYISSYSVHFEGHTNFTKNDGSALHVVNGLVNFQNSSATFANNRALHGGAMALIGSSIFIVGPNRNYEFIENSAVYKGGAIYVSLIDNVDFISSEICFIQCVDDNNSIISWDWNTNITFNRNYAKDETAGHTIYATSLHPCQAIYNFTTVGQEKLQKYTLVDTTEVFNVRGIKFDEGIQIATDGAILHSNRPSPPAIIPGERYEHNVTVTDDLGQTINASFWTVFERRGEEKGVNIQLASHFSTVITDRIDIRGKPNQKATLNMNLVSARQSFIQLDVEVLDCPPGFVLSDNAECICNTKAHVGMFDCDLDSFQSHLVSGYWAGYINDSQNISRLVTSACFYCNYSLSESGMTVSDFEVILPRNRSKLDEAVCGVTRTGIVCGKCRDGYTVHFHSPDFMCKQAEPVGCMMGWLFYILSELVPVTVVFITVLVLNISFTSGAVNGFILFSQLLASFDLNAGGIVTFPLETLRTTTQGYQIFYGFFNLDLLNSESLSFCLWKGASALDMLAFKYITILYTALLIIAVICIMNKCGGKCLGKCCRITTIKASVIHGISNFLMIGYSQCITVSLNLLLQVHIFPSRDGDFKPQHRLWYNGEIVHFSKEHMPYALPAIFCLLAVGILPPVLLLIYPLLNKIVAILGLEEQKFITCILRVPSTSNLKPFFDSFQGCFKDNMRFFAGVYFVYRWVILLININTVGFFEYYTAVGGFLVFILTLHTVCQPYNKRSHNIIDALLLCNLALINFLSLFNFYRSNNPKIPNSTIIASATVQVILIYLPALVVTACMLFYFCKYIYGCVFCKNQVSTKTIFVPKRARKLKNFVRSISSLNENSESSDEDFTHDQLMDEDVEFKPTCEYHGKDSCGNTY